MPDLAEPQPKVAHVQKLGYSQHTDMFDVADKVTLEELQSLISAARFRFAQLMAEHNVQPVPGWERFELQVIFSDRVVDQDVPEEALEWLRTHRTQTIVRYDGRDA